MSEEFVFKPSKTFVAEYGCIPGVRFLDRKDVIAYDRNGNEIVVPKCSVCGWHKNMLIGRESFGWICSNGCKDE